MALQLEAGFGHAVRLLERSHLCIATGTEGKEDKLTPALAYVTNEWLGRLNDYSKVLQEKILLKI